MSSAIVRLLSGILRYNSLFLMSTAWFSGGDNLIEVQDLTTLGFDFNQIAGGDDI